MPRGPRAPRELGLMAGLLYLEIGRVLRAARAAYHPADVFDILLGRRTAFRTSLAWLLWLTRLFRLGFARVFRV